MGIDGKKYMKSQRGRIMTGNISNGNEPAGTSGSQAVLYGQNANIISWHFHSFRVVSIAPFRANEHHPITPSNPTTQSSIHSTVVHI